MAENADRRKLAAILCADVKGYSKLMGEDESYTVGALKERRKLFAENIQTHGGRVVNAPGDSILAEFPSVVSAVQCAVEVHELAHAGRRPLGGWPRRVGEAFERVDRDPCHGRGPYRRSWRRRAAAFGRGR